MAKQLIAQVPTAVVVDGKRRIVQPGEALPEVSAAEQHELVASKAAARVDAPIHPEAEKEPTESPKKARGKS